MTRSMNGDIGRQTCTCMAVPWKKSAWESRLFFLALTKSRVKFGANKSWWQSWWQFLVKFASVSTGISAFVFRALTIGLFQVLGL
jgi:hypothetical protein